MSIDTLIFYSLILFIGIHYLLRRVILYALHYIVFVLYCIVYQSQWKLNFYVFILPCTNKGESESGKSVVNQDIATRTRTRAHAPRTRTRVQFCFHFVSDSDSDSDSESEIVTRDSTSSKRIVPYCAVYSDIRYILLPYMLSYILQMLNMCTTRFMTRKRFFFLLGLADSDSDSDLNVMTRTRTHRWWLGHRTRIWQPGLGHSTVDRRVKKQIRDWSKPVHISYPTPTLQLNFNVQTTCALTNLNGLLLTTVACRNGIHSRLV